MEGSVRAMAVVQPSSPRPTMSARYTISPRSETTNLGPGSYYVTATDDTASAANKSSKPGKLVRGKGVISFGYMSTSSRRNVSPRVESPGPGYYVPEQHDTGALLKRSFNTGTFRTSIPVHYTAPSGVSLPVSSMRCVQRSKGAETDSPLHISRAQSHKVKELVQMARMPLRVDDDDNTDDSTDDSYDANMGSASLKSSFADSEYYATSLFTNTNSKMHTSPTQTVNYGTSENPSSHNSYASICKANTSHEHSNIITSGHKSNNKRIATAGGGAQNKMSRADMRQMVRCIRKMEVIINNVDQHVPL